VFEFDKQEVEKIQRKTIAVSLVLFATLATAVGVLAFAADPTSTNFTNTTSTTPSEQFVEPRDMQFGGGMITDMQGFGGGPCGHRGAMGFRGGMTNIEVSSEYTAKINAILNNDSDVQNLISQGYNVTAINPIIKNIVESDGTLTTKATTAVVLLQNGTSGYTTVNVDVTNAKITQIVTITRTVIDKSST
jgi:hypothetical protein